jgi:hypothetical protein
MSEALAVDGKVDRIERLHQNPPVEWDGTTAWAADDMDGEKVLIETALIDCPECSERAYWARGIAACTNCQQRHTVIG